MTQAHPLDWPEGWVRTRPEARVSSNQFLPAWDDTVADLHQELDLLGASEILVSSNVPARRDGLPYADVAHSSRIADPGAAVYFRFDDTLRVMANDVYDTVHDNLHSLRLALAALRALERHGGALMQRALAGFRAPDAAGPAPWWQVLGVPPSASAEEVDIAYRRIARGFHPDHGGSDAQMAGLNRAREESRQAR